MADWELPSSRPSTTPATSFPGDPSKSRRSRYDAFLRKEVAWCCAQSLNIFGCRWHRFGFAHGRAERSFRLPERRGKTRANSPEGEGISGRVSFDKISAASP